MNPEISVSSVCERDIDFIMLEEFVSSPDFASWFLCHANLHDDKLAVCVSAHRSVTDSNGESDLEITFRRENGEYLLLMIENKIGAELQPTQAERYHIRAKNYLEAKTCHDVKTIIVAPEKYFGDSKSSKGFDVRITYEEILKWFQDVSPPRKRDIYKAFILQESIQKSSLGYQPIFDDASTKFWRDYWEVCGDRARELRMAEPKARPSGSDFITFKPNAIPSELGQIVHKLRGTKGSKTGCVDLQLSGMGDDVAELEQKLEGLLLEGMDIIKTSKSASIRLTVDKIDPRKSAPSQMTTIITGIDAAQILLEWFKSSPSIEQAIKQVRA